MRSISDTGSENGVLGNGGRDLRTRCRAPKHDRRTRFARSAQSQLLSHAQYGEGYKKLSQNSMGPPLRAGFESHKLC
jgi:hypothetical protein